MIQWGDNRVAMVIVTMAGGWRTTVNVYSIRVKRIRGAKTEATVMVARDVPQSHCVTSSSNTLQFLFSLTVSSDEQIYYRLVDMLVRNHLQVTCAHEPVAGCKP